VRGGRAAGCAAPGGMRGARRIGRIARRRRCDKRRHLVSRKRAVDVWSRIGTERRPLPARARKVDVRHLAGPRSASAAPPNAACEPFAFRPGGRDETGTVRSLRSARRSDTTTTGSLRSARRSDTTTTGRLGSPRRSATTTTAHVRRPRRSATTTMARLQPPYPASRIAPGQGHRPVYLRALQS
jgi:hypothetical protein